MNRTQLVQAVVWLDAMAARAKAEAGKLRADLAADARAEFEEQGTAPTWRIKDVAAVSSSVSNAAVYVDDEPAFTAWVAKRYPTEIETITRVRPAWQGAFLNGVPGAHGIVTDLDTGECVPGLAIRAGGEFVGISIRATAAAKEVFGTFAAAGLRQLAASAGPAIELPELPDARA